MLFVDGNSTDNTVKVLKENHFKVITSKVTGRGAQLSFGASNVASSYEFLLFLHVDTKLPDSFELEIMKSAKTSKWGHFDVRLDSNKFIYKIIQFMMNIRSRITGIATGDQAIFVNKDEFMKHAEAMIEHPIMEDIYLSKKLKDKFGKGAVIKKPVVTSVRYWRKKGPIKTIIKMWKFRLLYFLGVSPNSLYERYYK